LLDVAGAEAPVAAAGSGQLEAGAAQHALGEVDADAPVFRRQPPGEGEGEVAAAGAEVEN